LDLPKVNYSHQTNLISVFDKVTDLLYRGKVVDLMRTKFTCGIVSSLARD